MVGDLLMSHAHKLISGLFRNGTREHRAMMEDLSEKLSSKVMDDYLLKSQGGRDSNGNKWPMTKKGPPIMIDTGWLISQLNVSWEGSSLSVNVPDHAVPYVKYALGRFPLWPSDDKIPRTWKETIKNVISDHVNRLVKA